MSYGLQISASGVMAALYRQDVYANNLANVETAGFKPDVPTSRPRLAVREEDGLRYLSSNRLLERLGGGVLLNANRTEFAQGSLKRSGNALDMAIQGDGFFVVRDEADSSGDRVRLTRDGRFTRDSGGRLVMATSGMPVLDVGNRPILIPDGGGVTVEADGTLRQGNEAIARVQVMGVPDRDRLTKMGHSLFSAPADALGGGSTATGQVRGYSYEDSAADEIKTLMSMTSASREVDANVALMQQHDKMMERAINSLGRTA